MKSQHVLPQNSIDSKSVNVIFWAAGVGVIGLFSARVSVISMFNAKLTLGIVFIVNCLLQHPTDQKEKAAEEMKVVFGNS
jgi:hypothetical protein